MCLSNRILFLVAVLIAGLGAVAAKRAMERREVGAARELDVGAGPADATEVDSISQPSTNPTPYFDFIETDLYLGGYVSAPPPGTQAVLNLSLHQDSYKMKNQRWAPIPDSEPAPGLKWLRRQVEFIDEHRRAEEMVYVHCDAGISRGPMVTTAYLMWEHGLSRDDALALLRTHRAEAAPNRAFMQLLLDWQDELKVP